jgi:acetyltransferase EpsM
MKTKNLLIFGAGGHASKVVQVIRESGDFDIAGYISTEPKGMVINNYPVLGSQEDYLKDPALMDKYFHIAIGENSIRHRIDSVIAAAGQGPEKSATIISSHALIDQGATMEPGTSVMHHAVIWNRVSIGYCCIIDTGAIVEHDVTIGDFVNISPGVIICGGVNIGWGAIVGAGAIITEKVCIGENSLIGAGSVVINNIEPNTVAVGSPARVTRERKFTDTYLK